MWRKTRFGKGLLLSVALFVFPGALAMGLFLAGVANVPSQGSALANEPRIPPHLTTAKWAESLECERARIHLTVRGEGDPVGVGEPLDVMLVLDRSASMGMPEYPKPPIEHAKDAAKALLGELDPAQDQVGLVSYSDDATLDHGLTFVHDDVEAAIDALTAYGATNIGDAVYKAQAELGLNGRSEAVQVMVLLTDGIANRMHTEPWQEPVVCPTWPDEPTPCTNDAINQANKAKDAGTIIFTIGLLDYDYIRINYGEDVAALAVSVLQDMASDPAYYFQTPSPEDLVGIFLVIGAIITNTAGDNVEIIEVLPSYLHYVLGSAKVDGVQVEPVGPDLRWYLPRMEIGDEHEIVFDVTVDTPGPDLLMDEYPGSSTNYARVEYDDYQGNEQEEPFPETRQDVEACPRLADVMVMKSDDHDPVTAGTNLVYTLVVYNDGPSDAEGVEVADTLPAGVSYVSDDCGGSASGSTWTWSVGSLANGASVTCHITVHVLASVADGTMITNLASVSSTTTDTFPGNDTYTEVTVVQAEADLTIDKSDNPDPAVAGSDLVYTLVVTNNGPSDAINVVVTDDLPAGVSYVSDTDSCVEGPAGRLTCSLGDIGAGGSQSFNITVSADPDTSGVITGAACVSSDTTDPNPANDCDKEDTTVGGVCGDVDCNGSLQMLDAMMIAQYVMGLRCGGDVCDDPGPDQCVYLPAADVDCNGLVQMLDAMLVSQCVMGLIDCDCDCCWPCE